MRRYGQWAGNPGGVRERLDRCAQEIFSGDSMYIGRQCSKPRGNGENGEYCRVHAKRHPAKEGKESR